MKVWRVGHRTMVIDGIHIGPYWHRSELPVEHSEALRYMSQAHVDDDHPSPYWDPALRRHFTDTHACGFDSEEALYAWFANWTAALDAAGFVVRTYQVPDADVHCGDNGQVVFNMGSARLVAASPLNLNPVQLEIPGVCL
ncbi:hypothetical protein AB0F32_24575 [Streptomyces albidoflavus]|uniref:hypothetical protein n=1 Tax=Streptomyces albidoflavus TaxID=1886 RepID=UPI0033FB75F0